MAMEPTARNKAMNATCGQCGACTESEGAPRCGYSLSLGKVSYCESCWRKHHQHSPVVVLFVAIIGVLAVAGAIVAAQQHWTHVVWTLVNVGLLWAFIYVLIVPHELGHALVALLLGWQVFKISLGVGRRVATFNLLGLCLEFKAQPLGGHVWLAPRRLRFPRLEYCLITAAGPAANLVILLVLLQFTPLGPL